jgi:PAS domain S-box-containing protein
VTADNDEERLLRAVMHQNAESIFLARQRAERDLERAREALEVRSAELAASLALTQATLESTADGIVATDEAGRITGSNERFVRMWGIDRDALAAWDHRRLLHEMARQLPDPTQFLADVDAILAEAPPESFDVLELANGSVYERYTRVQRVDGHAIGRVWNYRDVTERARSEAALRAAKAEAEAASRAKSAFLAMMSHELRTPLNAIAGYAELIQMEIHGSITPPQRQALARIRASQQHLLRLIDEILMHATLEIGSVHYEPVALPAHEAITAAEVLLAPQAWAKGVTLVTPSGHQPATTLHADPEKVQQILVNLLDNAVKFTDSGGRVEVSCTAADSHVRIDVTDTGIGIPADMLEVIFEPFVQVRSELTRTAHGTGLGLAISRALARGMNGDLTAASEMGKGSVFTLMLPAAGTSR